MRKSVAFALVPLLALALLAPCAALGARAAPGDLTVSGLVVNDVGAPLPGVLVEARNASDGTVTSSSTDALGLYQLSLPNGTYNLTAALSGYSANVAYPMLEVTQDREGLDFTMSPLPGTVSGFVTSGEAPVTGVRVTLSAGELNYTGNSTAPFGRFDISGVRPGTYVARAEKQGYWTSFATSPVVVAPGGVTILNFTISPQPARVFGVVAVEGQGEEGVEVELLSGDVVVKQAVTDARGNYSLANVPSGQYALSFRKAGLESRSVQISLEPFAEQRLDVTMEREAAPGGEGFIAGLDLTHSMMVVGLVVSLLIMVLGLFIRARAMRHPGILAKEEESEELEKGGKG